MRSLTTAFVILVALATTGSCQSQEKLSPRGSPASGRTASEGDALAEDMWQKILTTCQIPGSSNPTVFF
jgi:hypothetical protein